MIKFNSQIARKLLGYYFINPQAKHYVNELARLLAVDLGNLSRKLTQLEKEGILAAENMGNQKYYFLNKKYPLLKEVKSIYEKNYGLKESLVKILQNLKGLRAAYIFGSYVMGKLDRESDIDILLIGSHSALEAKKSILPLQRRLGREFNIIDFTEAEFKKRKKQKDEFIQNIFKNKIIRII